LSCTNIDEEEEDDDEAVDVVDDVEGVASRNSFKDGP